ncbi:hypothetical protein BH10PSE17_BH10PSE17_17000 [soil metagenome]
MTARIKRTMPVPVELRTVRVREPRRVVAQRSLAWQRAAVAGGAILATIAVIWLLRRGDSPLES